MSDAIYFSRFLPSTDMGGGARRMMQIYEGLKIIMPGLRLITSARGDLISEKQSDMINKNIRRKNSLSWLVTSSETWKWGEGHRKMIYHLRKISNIWADSLKALPDLNVAIIDDPIYFYPLFKKLKKLNISVIAVCHNIETLVKEQTNNKFTLNLLGEELEIFSGCRLVITISREEDVFLKNLGISTFFCPYYPVAPIYDRLLSVREKRKSMPKENILMMGSTNNLPTRYGMEQMAAYWHKNDLAKTFGRLMIAGFRSEINLNLAPYRDSIDFRGTLTNQDADDLLSRVRALLIYQENGAGALTRICEMLIAGVPVLANSHAARSYYHVPGLLEFRDLAGLPEALQYLNKFNEEIPVPSAPYVSYLSSKIKEVLV